MECSKLLFQKSEKVKDFLMKGMQDQVDQLSEMKVKVKEELRTAGDAFVAKKVIDLNIHNMLLSRETRRRKWRRGSLRVLPSSAPLSPCLAARSWR
jgi:hypothetical protein